MSYFFHNPQKRSKKKPEEPPNSPQNRHPSAQEQAAQRQEPQDASQQQAQPGIDAEQALAGIDGKQQKAGRQDQPEQQVQKPGQARPQAARAAQHIVKQAQPDPQGHRLQELPRLGRDRQLHQPKSRAKKPPASRAESS